MFKQVNNRGPETGRSYSIGILGQRDERRRRGRRKHPPLRNARVGLEGGGGNVEVDFTDARFTFNTSAPLSASAHLCPFSRPPHPSSAIEPAAIPASCAPQNTGLRAFICLSLYFLRLFLRLILLPSPQFPQPSSSLSLSPTPSLTFPRSLVMALACDTCGKLLWGPKLRTGHWYTESAGWQGYFWNL